MDNANPPLSPEEMIVLRDQLESEIRDLGELNRLIDIDLESTLNELAIAFYSNDDLGPNDFVVVDNVEGLEEGEIDPKLDGYFNLYPTK
jgi:hypothetical protein